MGAGAAGGWAAKELCERGLSVLLLDAGPQLDAADFPVQPPPERRLLGRAAALRRQPVQMRCAAFNARTRRFFVDDRENPYTTPSGQRFNWFRGRQVGGRLHVWARVVLRLSDRELGDWPLSAAELAPFYDRVEDFLAVDAVSMTPEELRFKTVVEEAWPGRAVLAPRLARHDPGPLSATIRAAQRSGNLELRPDAVVREVAVDERTGKATGVRYVDRASREAFEVRARVVVLCASTIETLRIMLKSTSRAHPRGLGNSSGALGQGLMDHVLTGLGGPLRGGHGTPDDRGTVTGFQVPGFDGWALQGGIGRDGPTWYFLAHGEMAAREESRVTLDPIRTDAWGMPVAHISCAPGPDEVAMAAQQLETMRELAAAAGLEPRTPPSGKALDAVAFRLWRSRLLARHGALLSGSAAHEIGGAPMGRDPSDSVLDPFGRCWDAENVFVTDGAAWPSGCCQNVTLTIMALTVRACDHIAAS